MAPVPTVLSQHAEEAAFLWLLRDLAVRAPHYRLDDLAELDGRLDAHLDGLRIGGDEGWEKICEELAWEEAGEVFVAALLGFESGDKDRIGEVLDVGRQSTELSRGVISALGWLAEDEAIPLIDELLDSEDPMLRRMGIGGCGVQRLDPGAPLAAAVAGADELPRARALKAAGELGRGDLLSHCQRGYESEDGETRFWAAWSGTLLGDLQAVPTLVEVALEGGPRAEQAAGIGARRMADSDAVRAWCEKVAEGEGQRRLAIRVAGAAGDPALVPWLFEMMEVEELARTAGEAFTWITGLDLAFEDLEGEWPAGFEAGPTESPEEEDVAMDADEDLPWPDPEGIRHWWQGNGGRFAPGTRYLAGELITPGALGQVLRTGRQRLRNGAALELSLLDAGRPLFPTRAPGRQQRALLHDGD